MASTDCGPLRRSSQCALIVSPKPSGCPLDKVPEPLPVAIDMSEITFTKQRDALVSLA
jgi:hypothetical protein